MAVDPVALRSPIVGRADADAAIEALFVAHYGSLVGLARLLLVGDRDGAEEVVQESFVRLHGAWRRMGEPERAPAYLRSIVVNVARNRLRRRRVVARRQPPPALEVAVEPDDVDRQAISRALRDLPTRQRECLVLRYWADLSERDIAAALGIAQGSVKSHLHRGLAALTERLEGQR